MRYVADEICVSSNMVANATKEVLYYIKIYVTLRLPVVQPNRQLGRCMLIFLELAEPQAAS